MTFKINGNELDPQPSSFQWLPREVLGYDGNGRPVYTSPREFEINWDALSSSEYNSLQDYFLSVGATGSIVIDLPFYPSGSYVFHRYSGCYMQEPRPSMYFTEHQTNIRLVITNIITEK